MKKIKVHPFSNFQEQELEQVLKKRNDQIEKIVQLIDSESSLPYFERSLDRSKGYFAGKKKITISDSLLVRHRLSTVNEQSIPLEAEEKRSTIKCGCIIL